ncbi:hypothetical protein Mapa_004290 [Marchantia paleacea]|nr:hypothetical protein Mapa_004290 [Marchantia paleacea]
MEEHRGNSNLVTNGSPFLVFLALFLPLEHQRQPLKPSTYHSSQDRFSLLWWFVRAGWSCPYELGQTARCCCSLSFSLNGRTNEACLVFPLSQALLLLLLRNGSRVVFFPFSSSCTKLSTGD